MEHEPHPTAPVEPQHLGANSGAQLPPPVATGTPAADTYQAATQAANVGTDHASSASTNSYPAQQYYPQAEWATPQPNASAPKPTNRRTLAMVGIAIVALVLGLGGLLALRGGGSNISTASGGAPFSLAAASNNATDAKSIAFDMTVDGGGQLSMTMNSRINLEAKTMQSDLSLQGQSMTMILDSNTNTMYFKGDGMGTEVKTEWASVNLDSVPGFAEALGASFTDNPLGVSPLLNKADNVKEVGKQNIDGREVMQYTVTLSRDEMKANLPDYFDNLAPNATDALPDEIVYQVYVTENNELARLVYDVPVAGSNISTTINVKSLNEIEPIEIPNPTDVTDMTQELDGLGG